MADMVEVRRPPVNQFAQEPQVNIGRSQFNRSHGLKMTFDASYLYPMLLDEVLPGDTYTVRMNGFARIFSPLDAPVMDNIEIETFFFFVPTRLLWDNWEFFQGAHTDAGAQDTDYTIPIMDSGLVPEHGGSGHLAANLAAAFGLPQALQSAAVDVNALPFRAYNLIYNDWFRDQNLIASAVISTGNGPDTPSWFPLRKTAKKHDYFTSCLPYLQKGDEVSVALVGDAPVLGIGSLSQVVDQSGSVTLYESDQGSRQISDRWESDGTSSIAIVGDAPTGAYPQIFADLSAVSGVSINALRESVAIQRLLERDARGGTRYVEIIKSHFGVTSPDYRLQRPEYLGGGKSYINISPVANTSATATEDQGQLAGIGTGSISGHSFAKSFTEHGYIMGLVRARGDITYYQGVDRMWSRSTRYDFYMPALANLGEQSVLNKEIWNSNSAGTDDAVFGYQERWSEYRFKPSRIVGKLNPDVSGNLGFWHLAEDFASLPPLNQTFIEDQTPMSRITTVDTEPDFLLDAWFDMRCARPIPIHSIPSIQARF